MAAQTTQTAAAEATRRARTFAGHPREVRAVRAFVRSTLTGTRVTDDTVDDMILIASELAANAIEHTRSADGSFAVEVVASSDGDVAVYVTDAGSVAGSVPHIGTGAGEDGRGMMTVAALADSWGYQPGPDGLNTTWCQRGG